MCVCVVVLKIGAMRVRFVATALLAAAVALSVADEFDGAPEHDINTASSAASTSGSRAAMMEGPHVLSFEICNG